MQPKVDTWTCPHCGNENIKSVEAWIGVMKDSRSTRCPVCGKEVDGIKASISQEVKKNENRKFHIFFYLIFALLLCLILYLNSTFKILSMKTDWAHLVYVIAIILFISSAVASGKIRKNIKYLLIWAGIFILFFTGYCYRFELAGIRDRVMMELVPSKGFQEKPDSISFPVSSDGHFYIQAKINSIPIIFLADTGASSIVLSPEDAERIGINLSNLNYDRFYETANGNVRGSSIQISDLKIGEIYLNNIGASVNEAEMRNSLLGMTFFKRLKGYEVKNDVLTLYWDVNGK